MEPFDTNLDPRNLSPHPKNSEIYADRQFDPSDQEFLLSIGEGIDQPIHVTTSNVIISGHRRCGAAVHLGLESVPVRVRCDLPPDADSEEVLSALLKGNEFAPKSAETVAREIAARLRLAKGRAKQRHGKPAEEGEESGAARDVVSRETGHSPASISRASEAVEALDEAIEAGDEETAEEIRQGLNQSFTAGADAARKAKGKKEGGKKSEQPKSEPQEKATTLDQKIREWCKPFSGLVRKIGELKSEFAGLANGEGGRFVTDVAKQEFVTAAGQLQEIVKHSQPALHKACKGKGCDGCDRGFVRKS